MKRKNNRGFTVAELLIVIAIIAVFAAITISTFTAHDAQVPMMEAVRTDELGPGGAMMFTP